MGKSPYVLGISAFYHDSSAAILADGEIVAAAQEERFTRRKHDPRFPLNAINYCLEEAFIEPEEIDLIVFYDNPILTYDRVLKNALIGGENTEKIFREATESVLGIKIWVDEFVHRALGTFGKHGRVLYAGHHISHASSAFFPTRFDSAAILTLDGVGEWATTTICKGSGNSIEIMKEINYPHSLGLLYSAFTFYCGFKVNSGEYKLMGLAPYGEPIYETIIYDNLIDVKEDGSFRLNMDYFGWMKGNKCTNEAFDEIFEGPPRTPESRITKKEMDIAASIQKVTESVVIKLARHAGEVAQSTNLCIAGGVALNCVANGKLLKENIFENIWIQPAAGDAGGALGAAYVGHYLYLNCPRLYPKENEPDLQKGSFLGPSYTKQQIQAFLDRNEYPYELIEDDKRRHRIIAEELANGSVVGYFSGRMEFGPRSLGSRSILADARDSEMQSKMNIKIKYRESFRPFAPVVLEEDSEDYFELGTTSPYMLLVAPVNRSRLVKGESAKHGTGEDMIKIINEKRSDIPAITHVDNSARVQTLSEETNGQLHAVLSEFKAITGYSVLINTSFNVRGEPIVCSPKDAYTCFMRTGIDTLVLEKYILRKEHQPSNLEDTNWREEFKLD